MKHVTKIIGVLIVAYWLLLAHVSFNFLDDIPSTGFVSKDGRYKILFRDIYPVNPIGLYCSLTTESPIYFSLYDARHGYVGQSSPFACYNQWNAARFAFPGEEFTTDADSFVVFDDEYNGALSISTKRKRWWSVVLAPFQ